MFMSKKEMFIRDLNKAIELLGMVALVAVGIAFFSVMFMAFC